MKKPTTQRVKGWAVLKKKNGQLERFAAEGMAPHHVIYPIKRHMNEDLFAIVPCTIEYVVPKKLVSKKK